MKAQLKDEVSKIEEIKKDRQSAIRNRRPAASS
jgi:hypothetical protein